MEPHTPTNDPPLNDATSDASSLQHSSSTSSHPSSSSQPSSPPTNPSPSSDPNPIHSALSTHFRTLTSHETILLTIEHQYRHYGRIYHLARLCTRDKSDMESRIPSEALSAVHAAYHLSCPEEYASVFSDLENLLIKVTNTKIRYMRPATHHTQLVDRLEGLSRIVVDIETQFTYIEEDFDVLYNSVRVIVDAADRFPRLEQLLLSPHLPVRLDVIRNMDEWKVYEAWVGSLPETGMYVRLGRKVEEVAWGMLTGGFAGDGEDEGDVLGAEGKGEVVVQRENVRGENLHMRRSVEGSLFRRRQ